MNVETIATHDGVFHHDEVFAVAGLRLLYPSAKVIRTRDEKILQTADLRIDVGERSRPETGDYDHHQRGGAGQRRNGVPYSSFGLVWRHYGPNIAETPEAVRDVDERLVQRIDGVDTGFFRYDSREGPALLNHVIASLNPAWHETPDRNVQDRRFGEAVDFAQKVLQSYVVNAQGRSLQREIMGQAIQDSASHPDYLILSRFCPWQRQAATRSQAKYVIFPDDQWMFTIGAVPLENGQRGEYRLRLPKSWAGLNGDSFEKVSGVSGAVFCHNAGFMARAKTLEGALQLVSLALKQKS